MPKSLIDKAEARKRGDCMGGAGNHRPEDEGDGENVIVREVLKVEASLARKISSAWHRGRSGLGSASVQGSPHTGDSLNIVCCQEEQRPFV
jgi:hypothetical protein